MNSGTSMFDLLSNELAFGILVNLADEHLRIFAAASEGNRLLVSAADAYGLGVCVIALGEAGVTLNPFVARKTEFIGVSFLRFQGTPACDIFMYYEALPFTFRHCIISLIHYPTKSNAMSNAGSSPSKSIVSWYLDVYLNVDIDIKHSQDSTTLLQNLVDNIVLDH